MQYRKDDMMGACCICSKTVPDGYVDAGPVDILCLDCAREVAGQIIENEPDFAIKTLKDLKVRQRAEAEFNAKQAENDAEGTNTPPNEQGQAAESPAPPAEGTSEDDEQLAGTDQVIDPPTEPTQEPPAEVTEPPKEESHNEQGQAATDCTKPRSRKKAADAGAEAGN